MPEHVFTCTHADGHAVRYTVTLHRASEGAPIAMALLGRVVEPLAAGAGPVVMRALERADRLDAASIRRLIADDPEVLAALDLGKLGASAKRMLLELPMPLVYAILRYTNRDGKPLVTNEGQATGVFDEAYARNYMELAAALWGVARFNGFFPALSTLSAAVARDPDPTPAPAQSGA